MNQQLKLTGRCLCGAVKITGMAKAPAVAACHCDMCRRWAAGPFFEVTCENVTVEGEENVTRFRSSEWAERAFCNKCGSNLFYQPIGSDEVQVSAGLFDDPSKLRLAMQYFTDQTPPYYTLADDTECMTAAEVYAAYAPPT